MLRPIKLHTYAKHKGDQLNAALDCLSQLRAREIGTLHTVTIYAKEMRWTSSSLTPT